jgi:hypothetical protein
LANEKEQGEKIIKVLLGASFPERFFLQRKRHASK